MCWKPPSPRYSSTCYVIYYVMIWLLFIWSGIKPSDNDNQPTTGSREPKFHSDLHIIIVSWQKLLIWWVGLVVYLIIQTWRALNSSKAWRVGKSLIVEGILHYVHYIYKRFKIINCSCDVPAEKCMAQSLINIIVWLSCLHAPIYSTGRKYTWNLI